MNYPVWNVPVLGSGLVVAMIATVHVLISHFAIGGGAFLAVAELWSDRNPHGERIRAWLHRYATFFLVFTTVFGAVTGVGIWFAIQLASPEATSLLIHQFVFAWAIEWVVFLAELSVLYLYYYGWQSNPRSTQRFLAIAYFVIAWFSLVIINGILSFMLTPGAWTLANTDIFSAFFNPTYWPSLFIRTLVMFVIAGLGAFLIAARVDDQGLKSEIVSFAAKWVIPAAVLVPLFTLWYWSALPTTSIELFDQGIVGAGGGRLEALSRYFWLSVVAAVVIVLGTALQAAFPKAVHQSSALALLLTAFLGVLGAEFFREMARKPYVVYGALYSNSLWRAQADDERYLGQSFLSHARWAPPVERGTLEHGEWVFRLQCASCHTLEGYRGLDERTADWRPEFGRRFLTQLDAQKVMPPFHGDEVDRRALTAFLVSRQEEAPPPSPSEEESPEPAPTEVGEDSSERAENEANP